MSLCYLLNVARLEDSILISKADYNVSEYRDLTYWRIGSQYTVETNEKVSTRITLNPPTVNTLYITSVCFNGTTTNGDELEYFARVYNYNSSYVVSETEWLPANDWCNIFEISYAPNSNPSGTLEIWLRRKDGGILTPSSLDRTLVTMRARYSTRVPTPPADYYATTTQTIPTYTTQTTMVTTVDYESYLSTLTVPADVRPAIATLDQLINDLWSLHYIPFVVCFALIMGLAIWLLH